MSRNFILLEFSFLEYDPWLTRRDIRSRSLNSSNQIFYESFKREKGHQMSHYYVVTTTFFK